MMLGVSGLMGSSGDGVAVAEAHESGGAIGGSSEVGASSAVPGGGVELETERSGGGGNRWPKQETLALLKIRFDMDVAFRDSNLKGPLWEEVSRKMTELGFQRSGKKCRDKFENVNKCHKRTKDGRASNPVGKTYRFFDQLQAWENTPVPVLSFSSTHQARPPPTATTMTAAPMQTNATSFPIQTHVGTVPSISPDPLSIVNPNNSIINTRLPPDPLQAMNTSNHPQIDQPFKPLNCPMNSVSNSTSSSTSSDEGIKRQRGKKRKWKDFFQSLMKNVFEKQEELHKKFLDTLDKRERDRMTREEARRNQETERINREHELLVQKRSISSAKDEAVVAFLQKLTQQSNFLTPKSSKALPPEITQPPQQTPPPPPQQSTLPHPAVVSVTPTKILNSRKTDVFGNSINLAGSLRWQQAEVEALINLRTSLDLKYQEKVEKGPLWEEISAAMGKLGYNRSSKRCKEKWENINKYFKKVKECNKKVPEDSKTCTYFHRLDVLHKERTKSTTDIPSSNYEYLVKPNNPMAQIMARPEQQWPVPEQQKQDSTLHDQDQDEEIENSDHAEDVEEEEDGGGYVIVANKHPSSMANAAEGREGDLNEDKLSEGNGGGGELRRTLTFQIQHMGLISEGRF